MIITFCGHSTFYKDDDYEAELMELLERKIGNEQALFYLGEHGGFDRFAHKLAKEYKRKHPSARLIHVTPYLEDRRLEYDYMLYDEIIYPEIENVPKRFAIVYRNYFMVERADLVIAYISRDFGGAYKTYAHAKKKGKEIYNIGILKE